MNHSQELFMDDLDYIVAKHMPRLERGEAVQALAVWWERTIKELEEKTPAQGER